MESAGTGLKCLSARFVIDINKGLYEAIASAASLKCLSARFVIDM